MKKILIWLATSTLTLFLTGCGTQPFSTDGPQVVKIGVLLSLSGPASSRGEDGLNAYNYEVEKFNATHSQVQIQLIVEDSKCEGKDAVSAIQKLVNVDKVQAITAGYCSAEVLAAGRIAQDNGVFLISPGASSSEISTIGEYVFKLFDNRFMADSFAEYLANHQVPHVVALIENTAYATDILNALTNTYAGQIEKVLFQADEKDFLSVIKQAKTKLTPDSILLFIPNSDGNTIAGIKAMEREGVLELMQGKIIGGEIIGAAGVYEAVGSALNGIKLAQLKQVANFPEA
jgi:branched-chain amino acid transport system substrate-binding protein